MKKIPWVVLDLELILQNELKFLNISVHKKKVKEKSWTKFLNIYYIKAYEIAGTQCSDREK